jgi:hypothetical protein
VEAEETMFDTGLHQDDGVLDIRTRHLSSAQAKWDRLTARDYADIRTVPQLITAVGERYSLPHERAKQDVESWLRHVRLQA